MSYKRVAVEPAGAAVVWITWAVEVSLQVGQVFLINDDLQRLDTLNSQEEGQLVPVSAT